MFLKPVKTYGKEFRAKIYRHYVEVFKQSKLGLNRGDYTHYVVYPNKDSATILYGFDLSELQGGEHTTQLTRSQIANAMLEDTFKEYKVYVGDIIYFPYLDKFGKLGNNRPIFYSVEEFKNISLFNELTTSKEISSNIELNKYYYLQSFNYMPIDNINDNNEQYIKGHIVNTESRSIKWEIDGIPLQVNDIVLLENGVAYIVEDILISQRIGMNVRKSYTANLIKVGV